MEINDKMLAIIITLIILFGALALAFAVLSPGFNLPVIKQA